VLGDADWTDLSVGLVERQAAAAVGSGGSMAAASLVAEGLKRLGRQPSLLQNYEAYVHNAFVPLFNLRKVNDARAVLDQGLSVYPDSALLAQDLELLKKLTRT
jgi:hypothetical protein